MAKSMVKNIGSNQPFKKKIEQPICYLVWIKLKTNGVKKPVKLNKKSITAESIH